MQLKIAQTHGVPGSHTPANTLLGRACQPLISDWQCEFREEVNICTVSCSHMLLAMPKTKSHVLSRHRLSLQWQTCMPKYVQNNKICTHTHTQTHCIYSVQRIYRCVVSSLSPSSLIITRHVDTDRRHSSCLPAATKLKVKDFVSVDVCSPCLRPVGGNLLPERWLVYSRSLSKHC